MDTPSPPAARVRFPAGFAARVAAFAEARLAERRTPREDFAESGARVAAGSGEFAGRRRYRPGDDLRAFDWEAFARGAGELVRLSRRESGERWAVLLDASASMAVGAPEQAPKLQLAAELALACCAAQLFAGGEVTLATRRGVRVFRSRADFPRAAAELDGLECAGDTGFGEWLGSRPLARASRVILIGDLLDAEPAFPPARRRVDAVGVLAAVELAPQGELAPDERVQWRDPERASALDARLSADAVARYAALLAEHHRRWRASTARTGGRLVIAKAGDSFESHALRLLRGPAA